jgi:hypothetical protein
MPDTQTLETQVTAQPQHGDQIHGTSESLRAAAVEAAYILEAVRK